MPADAGPDHNDMMSAFQEKSRFPVGPGEGRLPLMDDLDGKPAAFVESPSRRCSAAGALLLAVGLVLVGTPRSAVAGAAGERLEALRDLKEGNRLFDAGDYLAALARFERAYAKVPSPKLFFNFGQVHRRLGRTVEALEFYEKFLAEAPNASANLRAEAQQWIADLEKSVASVTISVDRAGAEVTVDGRSSGVTPLAGPVRVLPGTHQIVVQPGAAGAAPFVEKIVARAGQRIAIEAHLAAPVSVAASPAATGPVESAGPARPPALAPAADLVIAGVGGSAVAGGGSAARAGAAHRGHVGLRLRADVDRALAGAGAAGALDYGVLEHLAISAGGFLWPAGGLEVPGASLGLTAYLLGGAVRPLLAVEGQSYFQTGAHLGAHAAAGVQWDVADHAGVYAMAGVQYTSSEIVSGDRKLFFVPSLGLHLRL